MASVVDQALRWWSRTAPDNRALAMRGDAVSYRELDEWVGRVAASLVEAGIAAGDRVGLVGANSLEWCAAALGTLRIGAVLAPFSARLVARELVVVLDECTPNLVLASDTHHERLADAAKRCRHDFAVADLRDMASLREGPLQPAPVVDTEQDDPMAIMYTSGTTSKPKGVIITSRGLSGYFFEWTLREPTYAQGVRLLLALPLAGMPGIICGISRSILHGGTSFIEPALEPEMALRVMAEERINAMMSTPIVYEQIAALPEFADADLRGLTSAMVGGARVPVQLLRRYADKGVLLRQTYGLTEAGGPLTVTLPDEALEYPGTCGKGGLFTRIRIVRPDGTDCEPGDAGEIIVRGPGVTPGYWADEEATRSAIVDGWLHTGDLGKFDEDGRLEVVDRLKDMIISGGINISPAEIEHVLDGFPGVEEIAVIGVADPKFGETVAAVINSSSGVDIPAMIDYCNEKLSDYKVPRYVEVVAEPLPRLATGKISKPLLRSRYADLPQTSARVR